MKKSVLPVVSGAAGILLIPGTAHAHGGDVMRDYIHVFAAIFAGPFVCLLLVLAAVSAMILRGHSTSRGRAAYGVVAIALSVACIAAPMFILLRGGALGLAYATGVTFAGWASITLARRVIQRNTSEHTAASVIRTAKVASVAALLAVASLGFYLFCVLPAKDSSETRNINLADGTSLRIVESEGDRSRDEPNALQFFHSGKEYSWSGPQIPILLQFDGTVPVLVVFDRTGGSSEWRFRYYRHEGEWCDTALTAFPKNLAVQNLDLSTNRYAASGWVNEYDIVHRLDPDSPDFQGSFTAELWYCIEYGLQAWQVVGKSIDAEFLRDFKRRHIIR